MVIILQPHLRTLSVIPHDNPMALVTGYDESPGAKKTKYICVVYTVHMRSLHTSPTETSQAVQWPSPKLLFLSVPFVKVIELNIPDS